MASEANVVIHQNIGKPQEYKHLRKGIDKKGWKIHLQMNLDE